MNNRRKYIDALNVVIIGSAMFLVTAISLEQ